MPDKKGFCRYLLQGKCTKGKDCKFRHHGPERPIATAFACEVLPISLPSSDVQKLLSDDAPAGSYTQVLRDGVKATFTAGLVPTDIQFLGELRPKTKVHLVTTALEVSWYQPCHIIWLMCANLEHALNVIDALKGKSVHGVKLHCAMQKSDKSQKWTVEITNATESIKTSHVLELLQPHVRTPVHARSGPRSYDPFTAGIEIVRGIIAAKTNRKITDSAMANTPNKTKFKAIYKLEGTPNIEILARSLNGQKVPELGNSKLYVRELMTTSLSIDKHAYTKHARTLKNIAAREKKEDSVCIHFDNNGDLTIRGNSRELIVNAKAALDKVFTRDMQGVLAKLQPFPQEQARSYRIELEQIADLLKVQKGGLEKARAAVGDKKAVHLDTDSDRAALVVRGDALAVSKAYQAVFAGREDQRYSTDCMICYDEAGEAIRVPGCDHMACKDCLASYCTVDADHKLPLHCFAPDCDELLPMILLRQSLSDDALQPIMQQTLANHFVSNPQEYGQCPGHGCEAWYKIDGWNGEKICPSCFTIICTSCKVEQHFGKTCEAYQDETHGQAALERWIREGRAKRCTKCRAIIQKNGGCNNMQCQGCRSHFCFTCMEILPSHQAVYTHMLDRHGNYGDEEAQQLQREIDEQAHQPALRRVFDHVPFVARPPRAIDIPIAGARGDDVARVIDAPIARPVRGGRPARGR